MLLARRQRNADPEMSPAIYAGMVDSLFMNPAPMIFGAFAPAIAGCVIGVMTGDLLNWICVPLFVLVGFARALQMHRYRQRNAPLSPEDADIWEQRYRIGGLAHAILLGVWSMVVLLNTKDMGAHMVCITTIVAYTSAGVGRTFGRPKIFQMQVLLSCGPLCLAMIAVGGVYYWTLAFFSTVFFGSIRHLTSSLQRIYLNAWIGREREAALAQQFDTALNNMPHGLCMFRADGTLAVMNQRFAEMMKLRGDQGAGSPTSAQIVSACVTSGAISAASGRLILADIDNSRAGEIVTVGDEALPHSMSWTFQP
ncbi:PAS-domain containing protein, partial [Rhodopseudomonas sp. B29]|uniref:PAS-domain containing protein n=1 Tax=Rhodopseudomonas sp. B29 TaxID=95607 RepID=UPI0003B72488